MTPLSHIEKNKHHEAIGQFIKVLNGSVLDSLWPNSLQIVQVAYGVKVEEAYLYFDYPYSRSVDQLNEALTTDEAVKGIDVFIHNKFFEAQKEGVKGLIHYKYRYVQKEKHFEVYFSTDNIGCTEPERWRFLPIIHSAVTRELNFKAPVKKQLTSKGDQELIVLCEVPRNSSLQETSDSLFKNAGSSNVVVSILKVTNESFKLNEEVTTELYQKVMYLIESYFVSPVAEKILQERKKSEVLAYHHSFNNLEIESCIAVVDDLLANPDSVDKGLLKKAATRFRTMLLLQYCLFQAEYLRLGSVGLNRSENLPLLNKTVGGIVESLASEYNLYPVKNNLVVSNDASKVDFIPLQGNREDLNPEFYDILLILYNLCQNANQVAYGKDAEEIKVQVEEKDNCLLVTYINKGRIRDEYQEFLTDYSKPYPIYNTDPNKLYRGLEIVRDKCSSHNRKWKPSATTFLGPDEIWYTVTSIYFLR